MRILYRVGQFWHTVFIKHDENGLKRAQAQLTPAQWGLFRRLQPAEQAHAIRTFVLLIEQGESQPDLLTAALLHDVGKLRYPMKPFERALVVMLKMLLPELARRWGTSPRAAWEGLPGWRKAFVVSEQHPAWGADLARQAGVSPLTEELVRTHQYPPLDTAEDGKTSLRDKLWAADNDY